jgi:hypothetical protein
MRLLQRGKTGTLDGMTTSRAIGAVAGYAAMALAIALRDLWLAVLEASLLM